MPEGVQRQSPRPRQRRQRQSPAGVRREAGLHQGVLRQQPTLVSYLRSLPCRAGVVGRCDQTDVCGPAHPRTTPCMQRATSWLHGVHCQFANEFGFASWTLVQKLINDAETLGTGAATCAGAYDGIKQVRGGPFLVLPSTPPLVSLPRRLAAASALRCQCPNTHTRVFAPCLFRPELGHEGQGPLHGKPLHQPMRFWR